MTNLDCLGIMCVLDDPWMRNYYITTFVFVIAAKIVDNAEFEDLQFGKEQLIDVH